MAVKNIDVLMASVLPLNLFVMEFTNVMTGPMKSTVQRQPPSVLKMNLNV